MQSVLMLNHMKFFIFYKHIKNKEQIRHFFFIITRSIAGVVLTASTIAFQAIGTGSNPVTRSIYLLIAFPLKLVPAMVGMHENFSSTCAGKSVLENIA